MAEQHLDRPDVDPRFKEVRRETMAERLETVAVGDPRGPLGVRGDFLGRADGHRCMGIEAGKQPRGGPVKVPIGAQCGQEAGGEQRVAILASFACSTRISPRSLSMSVSLRRTTSLTRKPAA